MNKLISFLLMFTFYAIAYARPVSDNNKEANLTIDGQLSEVKWKEARHFNGFRQNYPVDTLEARGLTDVWVMSDGDFLIIGARMTFNKKEDEVVGTSLKRDFSHTNNDVFGVVINPDGDKIRGFGFQVNPFGAQADYQIFSGNKIDMNWNQQWEAASTIEENGWTIEMKIPFSSLRYNQLRSQWNFNFYRTDMKGNEYSSWNPIPRNFMLWDLAFTQAVAIGENIKGKTKALTFIPSLTTLHQNTYKAADFTTESTIKPSLDVKLSLSSALNLDVTLNPDFSQTEADITFINATRFEPFLPEKRQFFIENSDLFAEFGVNDYNSAPVRPFYSRRIGLGYNERSKLLEPVPIYGGLRMSGTIRPGLRVGLMSIQTALQENFYQDEDNIWHYLPGQNYSALALQQDVGKRSTVGFIFANRQAFHKDTNPGARLNKLDYNRVTGFDYTLGSANGRWTGKAFLHHSYTGLKEQSGFHWQQATYGSDIKYNSRKIFFSAGHTFVGKEFNAESGFVPRKDYFNIYGEGRIFFYPKKSKKVNVFYPIVSHNRFLSQQGNRLDTRLIIAGTIRFNNTSYLNAWFLAKQYTLLRNPFDPSFSGVGKLPAGGVYEYNWNRIAYFSGERKPLQHFTSFEFGESFNGKAYTLSGNVSYRLQPWAIATLFYNTSYLKFPAPLKNNKVLFLGPQFQFSFTRKLFADVMLQYNSVSKNHGVYVRLQWEFKPLSNVFLVYQDNYYESFSQLTNRNLSAKLIYWL